MSEISKARDAANNMIAKYPEHKNKIKDTFDLMIAEIESGESEDNELNHYYSDLNDLML